MNLDDVRHFGDFLDLSEELANAFATGECLLRHRGLSFRRPAGRTFRSTIAIAPGLNFGSFLNLEAVFRIYVLNLSTRPSKRKTTRGALDRTRSSQLIASRTAKARNCLSPNGLRRNVTVPTANRAFVLPPQYGRAIVELRGETSRIPTHFCGRRGPKGTFGPHRFSPCADPGSRCACPGPPSNKLRLLELNLGA